MSEADDLKRKIQELQGIIEQQNQQLQHSSSITNESIWMKPPQVYRVSPKLPPFWADKPAVCFAQAESQFALAHITSDATKFHYIVANLDMPKTARDLRRFLGIVNFYRRFLPSAAKYQSSLNDALSGLRGAQPLIWTSELDTAFSKCKEALSEVTPLTHPAADVPLGLFTDASACHVGAALMQRADGNRRPLAFF
ncbi:uncharacterized protein TNIN_379921 [Trichonephila inaurata madagascariensis]|uniref:Reverse transcriptase/retrotransposon-derived protein RNase H-like domain-containing protein n=1 Tax=Trichonephila inaurata madagascariensis TaxID=2747483 RepID=A0A8X6YFF4_9ARAC|nr:uncharacterized protein TNIN_379921 [Trichonephila inaurata madagascariensis]